MDAAARSVGLKARDSVYVCVGARTRGRVVRPCLARQQQQQRPQEASRAPASRVVTSARTAWRTSDNTDLTVNEAKSLSKVLGWAGLKGFSQGQTQMLLHTMQQGVQRTARDLVGLEGAMLAAEQVFLGHMDGKFDVESRQAADVPMWQPVFASSGGFPRLLFIPVPEYFDFSRAPKASGGAAATGNTSSSSSSSSKEAAVNIITELGPLTTHFLGTCAWESAVRLRYTINALRLEVGGRGFSIPLAGPLRLRNTLTFFLVTDECACARSRLGGTMLLQPNPEQGVAKYLSPATNA